MRQKLARFTVFPSSHYVTGRHKVLEAIEKIKIELTEQKTAFATDMKLIEAQRIEQRTRFDLEMMVEIGFCNGIENYSRHLSGRQPGEPPPTLIDYFPKDFLLVIDESHQTVPQVRAMWGGDRARKSTLVEYGFRLPSAIDNRPLSFDEFQTKLDQIVYVSATPGPFELQRTEGQFVEQVIRPTGLLDPEIIIRPVKGQVDDLIGVIKDRVAKSERVMVTTLTKRMSEDLTRYLMELGIKVTYLHSDVETLERIAILRDFRLGVYDVLIGINLLREGLDIPEVSAVTILDADKEGFLRSTTSLIQTIGRAARNVGGQAILYADKLTDSLKNAIEETNRRRDRQRLYNEEHGIEPATIIKAVDSDLVKMANLDYLELAPLPGQRARLDALAGEDIDKQIGRLTKEMKEAAKNLDFEKAAEIRDRLRELKEMRIFV
jgi:excinuclease ABC subunit B